MFASSLKGLQPALEAFSRELGSGFPFFLLQNTVNLDDCFLVIKVDASVFHCTLNPGGKYSSFLGTEIIDH